MGGKLKRIFQEIGKNSILTMYIHLPVRDLIMKKYFGENYSVIVYVVMTLVIVEIFKYGIMVLKKHFWRKKQ